ncbi:MAG TPA: hypothetical protein VE574_02145 [Nitrososphaeraceae archaeon]|nr:hypothetical protein [Nitrososphaeraceae archaeon]
MKELTYVKKCFAAAAIAIVIIGFAEFNTLFVLVTMDLPAYAQRLENTTKLNITSSMADAPSRPSEKQFLPDQDSITVTPGLSTDELNTNTQQDSADLGENDLQGKILELRPEVLDQQRSEQNNGLVAKPTSDIETPSENLDEKQDETAGNFATQNEESEDSEQEDRQQTEEQRDESRTDENEADGNSAVSEGQNEQGKEDGDEGKENGNKDDSDGDEDKDEDKDEGDDNNEIPFELPFP